MKTAHTSSHNRCFDSDPCKVFLKYKERTNSPAKTADNGILMRKTTIIIMIARG